LSTEGTIIKGSLAGDIVNLEFSEPIASITIVGKGLSQSHKVLQQIIQKIKSAKTSLLGMSANSNSLIMYVPENMLNKILEPIHSVVLLNSKVLAIAVRRNLALFKIRTAELEETPGIVSQAAKALYSRNINIYGIFTIASGIHVFIDMASIEVAFAAVRNSIGECFEMNCQKPSIQ
jgi:aspartokinase